MSGVLMNEQLYKDEEVPHRFTTNSLIHGGNDRINIQTTTSTTATVTAGDQYWGPADSPLNLSAVKRECRTYPPADMSRSLQGHCSSKNYCNNTYYGNRVVEDYNRKYYYHHGQKQSTGYYSQPDNRQKMSHGLPEPNRHVYQGGNAPSQCTRLENERYKTYNNNEFSRTSHIGHTSLHHNSSGNYNNQANSGQMQYNGVYNNNSMNSGYHPYGNHYHHSNGRVAGQHGNVVMAPGVLKGGKKRVKNMFTALFAHCQVCGDRATGFHYGANTCEACKVRVQFISRKAVQLICVCMDQK